MSFLAYTVVQNDMILLDVWIRYYSRYFDKLHVLAYGTDPKYLVHLDILKKTRNLDYDYFEDTVKEHPLQADITINTVREHQRKFLGENEWVLYSNIDEFLIADPKRFSDLNDIMKNHGGNWIHAVAYDVIQTHDEGPLDYRLPILKQRSTWRKNIHYNKILLSRVPLDWNAGTHQISGVSDNESKELHNIGLILVHLKHADRDSKIRDLGPHVTSNWDQPDTSKEPIPEFIKII